MSEHTAAVVERSLLWPAEQQGLFRVDTTEPVQHKDRSYPVQLWKPCHQKGDSAPLFNRIEVHQEPSSQKAVFMRLHFKAQAPVEEMFKGCPVIYKSSWCNGRSLITTDSATIAAFLAKLETRTAKLPSWLQSISSFQVHEEEAMRVRGRLRSKEVLTPLYHKERCPSCRISRIEVYQELPLCGVVHIRLYFETKGSETLRQEFEGRLVEYSMDAKLGEFMNITDPMTIKELVELLKPYRSINARL